MTLLQVNGSVNNTIVLWFMFCLALLSASTDQHAICAVHRGSKETARFARLTKYPYPRPGYVVDHIVPLCACGADSVSNMQWQRQDSSYVKDTWERQMCRALAKDTLK